MSTDITHAMFGGQQAMLERIRELEGIISRAEKQELEELIELRHHVEDLEERIAKAREILEVTALDSESSWARMKAKEALDVLEGK